MLRLATRAVMTVTSPIVLPLLLIAKVLAVLGVWGGLLRLTRDGSPDAGAIVLTGFLALLAVAFCREIWDRLRLI